MLLPLEPIAIDEFRPSLGISSTASHQRPIPALNRLGGLLVYSVCLAREVRYDGGFRLGVTRRRGIMHPETYIVQS